jgi:type II secretory pathway pseudopilin PulG
VNSRKERGFTLINLSILLAIIIIVAAGAVPALLHPHQNGQNGNETLAIMSLKETTSAQVAYSKACGNGGYAASFIVLGTAPASGGPGFISADLGGFAAPQKDGYIFTLGAGAGAAPGPKDCNGTATITADLATASPMISANTTGTRSFAVNASNTIWQLPGGTPPREPFGAPATPIQ